jgi:integrase
VPFTPELVDAISTWQRPSAAEMLANPDSRYLLRGLDGKPWSRVKATSCWIHVERPLYPELEGLTLHGLRATVVVRLRRAGAEDHQIASLLGMSIPMVTRYCRKAKQVQDALAAVSLLSARRSINQAKREVV